MNFDENQCFDRIFGLKAHNSDWKLGNSNKLDVIKFLCEKFNSFLKQRNYMAFYRIKTRKNQLEYSENSLVRSWLIQRMIICHWIMMKHRIQKSKKTRKKEKKRLFNSQHSREISELCCENSHRLSFHIRFITFFGIQF